MTHRQVFSMLNEAWILIVYACALYSSYNGHIDRAIMLMVYAGILRVIENQRDAK